MNYKRIERFIYKGIAMSAKTKIVVLHMKELIYTGIFLALAILFIILLFMMLTPKKDQSESSGEQTVVSQNTSQFVPGIYTTELVLGTEAIDVEVIVDECSITSVRLVNLNESVTTMYPLLEPTLDSICTQLYESQSLDSVTYAQDSKYTTLVLMEAIRNSLDKARITENVTLPENETTSG